MTATIRIATSGDTVTFWIRRCADSDTIMAFVKALTQNKNVRVFKDGTDVIVTVIGKNGSVDQSIKELITNTSNILVKDSIIDGFMPLPEDDKEFPQLENCQEILTSEPETSTPILCSDFWGILHQLKNDELPEDLRVKVVEDLRQSKQYYSLADIKAMTASQLKPLIQNGAEFSKPLHENASVYQMRQTAFGIVKEVNKILNQLS